MNERGFVVKKLGEPACFGGAAKDCEGRVSFAIDKIEVDPTCSEYGSHPDNGHTVLLHLRVATGDDAEMIDRVGADPSANQLPSTYGPNQKYQGVMDLEVPEASGTIALQLMGAEEDGQRGWEWTYPA